MRVGGGRLFGVRGAGGNFQAPRRLPKYGAPNGSLALPSHHHHHLLHPPITPHSQKIILTLSALSHSTIFQLRKIFEAPRPEHKSIAFSQPIAEIIKFHQEYFTYCECGLFCYLKNRQSYIISHPNKFLKFMIEIFFLFTFFTRCVSRALNFRLRILTSQQKMLIFFSNPKLSKLSHPNKKQLHKISYCH